MGDETEPTDREWTVEWMDPTTGRWTKLSQVTDLQLAPTYPPGMVLGERVEQIRRNVYEVPDSLLVEKGITELWSFCESLRAQFENSNPGTELTIERDVVRSSTLFTVVTTDGDA